MRLLKQYKWFTAVWVSIGLAFSSAGLAVASNSAVAATKNKVIGASATVMKKVPFFLFVLQAKQGKIETKDGKTYLVLKKTDVHHVIMFSDRPNRIVKIITGKDL